MILLKCFLRKKTTKIYLVIFSILLLSIITLSSFINYYSSVINKIYERTAYITIECKTDCYKEIKKYKSVVHIQPILLLKPNYEDNVLGRAGYQIMDQHGNILDSRAPEENLRINWDDFIFHYTKEYIMVISNDERNLNLDKNDIALGLPKIMSSYDYFYKPLEEIKEDLIGDDISLYLDEQKHVFKIGTTYDTYFPEMTISSDKFNKLIKKSNTYAYKLITNDKEEAIRMERRLEKLDNIIDVYRNQMYNEGDNEIDNRLGELIDILRIVSYLVIFAFSFAFITIIKNILSDESKDTKIYRLLGYSKNKIRILLCIKVISLNIVTLLITIILSLTINSIFNQYLNISLELFNLNIFINTHGSILIISLVLCLLYGITIGKQIKD